MRVSANDGRIVVECSALGSLIAFNKSNRHNPRLSLVRPSHGRVLTTAPDIDKADYAVLYNSWRA
jgi:hypothetical protein